MLLCSQSLLQLQCAEESADRESEWITWTQIKFIIDDRLYVWWWMGIYSVSHFSQSCCIWFKTLYGSTSDWGVALIMLECQYQHGFQQEFKIVFSGCYVQSSHLLWLHVLFRNTLTPSASWMSISACFLTRIWTMFVWPFLAAMCRAVLW